MPHAEHPPGEHTRGEVFLIKGEGPSRAHARQVTLEPVRKKGPYSDGTWPPPSVAGKGKGWVPNMSASLPADLRSSYGVLSL